MFSLTPETPADSDEVEWLFDLAFAPGRRALSSYRLREGVAPVADLSLVARDEWRALAGAIRFWPVRIGPVRPDPVTTGPAETGAGAAGAPTLLLGPVAVHPTRQGEGLGALLLGETLSRARACGWERVILVGDEPYYRRFGFSREPVRAVTFPPPINPDRLLGQALTDGGFDGVAGAVSRWA